MRLKIKNIIANWIFPILLAYIAALLINKFLFYQIIVPTESMHPTIKVGDRIIVTRIYNRDKLKRGDIIVFYSHEKEEHMVKRLIGLPGDIVTTNSNEEVFLNGEKLNEPYVLFNDDLEKSFEVPSNHYLFFGDNRAVSFDSRRWNSPYIRSDDIKGRARFIIYPFSRFGKFATGPKALNKGK